MHPVIRNTAALITREGDTSSTNARSGEDMRNALGGHRETERYIDTYNSATKTKQDSLTARANWDEDYSGKSHFFIHCSTKASRQSIVERFVVLPRCQLLQQNPLSPCPFSLILIKHLQSASESPPPPREEPPQMWAQIEASCQSLRAR